MPQSITTPIRQLALLLAAALILVTLSLPGFAQSFEIALDKLTTDSYSDTAAAVGELANSGNPRALPIVQALQDGKLQFSAAAKKVYIVTATGLVDAATGTAVAPA